MTAPRTPDSPLRALLRVRQHTLRRALLGQGPGALAGRLVAGLLALAGVAGAGWASARPLAEAARAAGSDPGAVTTPGGPIVDAAFWLTALAIVVLSFRIMESLYRHRDAHLLAALPIPMSARFLDRLLASSGEAAVAFVLLSAFLLPIWPATGDVRALASVGLAAIGLLVSLTLGLAVQLYAGVTSFVDARGATQGTPIESLGRLDAGGGTAAAFYISPGLAMAASLGLLLWSKMAIIDEGLVRGASRLFWIGVAVPSVVVVVSLARARAWFMAHYPSLLARFYESDLIQIDTGYNYHTSVTHGRRGLFERMVPDRLLGLYRKDALQLGRRHPMQRILAGALWLVAALLASRATGASWLPAAVPVAWALGLSMPWVRLHGEELEPGVLDGLPVRGRDVATAKLLASLREIGLLALPAAVLILAFGPWPSSGLMALMVAAVPLALTPALLATTARLGTGVGRAASLLAAAMALVAGWAVGP